MQETLQNLRLLLSDPASQALFKSMLYREIKDLPKAVQLEIIEDYRRLLNGYH